MIFKDYIRISAIRMSFVFFLTSSCSMESSAEEENEATEANDSSSESEEFVMGSIGDSITQAMNSQNWGDNQQYNWSTGENKDGLVYSHYKRMKEIIEGNISTYNSSVSGAKSDQLEDQAREILDKDIDYLTILIGANDVCSWTGKYDKNIEEYKKNVENVVKIFIDNNPQIKILIAPIPNLYNLWEVGNSKSCQFMWDIAQICSPLLHSSRTEDERLAFSERTFKANNRLNEIANEYPNNVRYDPTLEDYEFEWEDVSPKDCFHPSIKGQNLISELTWGTGWYR